MLGLPWENPEDTGVGIEMKNVKFCSFFSLTYISSKVPYVKCRAVWPPDEAHWQAGPAAPGASSAVGQSQPWQNITREKRQSWLMQAGDFTLHILRYPEVVQGSLGKQWGLGVAQQPRCGAWWRDAGGSMLGFSHMVLVGKFPLH